MKTKSLIMRKLKSALIAKVFFILTFIIGLKAHWYDDKKTFGRNLCHNPSVYSQTAS